MNRLVVLAPRIAKQCIRPISTSQVVREEKREIVDISKLKENQKRFQVDDGLPVYLKGGASDRILFGITIGLIVIGLGYSAEFFYQIAK